MIAAALNRLMETIINMFNKSLMTNLIALIISILGVLFANAQLKAVGFYALSGAITNWLAIVMLFDKIPFVYGSGVIPRQFEGFKRAIKNMLLKQFFKTEYLERFLLGTFADEKNSFKDTIAKKVDYDLLFDSFVEAIMESQFGSMIESFLGGKDAIEPMRDSFKAKMEKSIMAMLSNADGNGSFKFDQLNAHHIAEKLESMIDARLEELTPKMVKNIIQEMIRKHLGWLVVWGGVFGAIIGLVASFFN